MSLSTTIESAVRRCAEDVRQATMADVRAMILTFADGPGRRPNGAGRPAASSDAAPATKPKRRISAKQRAAMKLTGQYMGFTRQLTPAQKKQVKVIRGTKGIVAAIALAKKMRG